MTGSRTTRRVWAVLVVLAVGFGSAVIGAGPAAAVQDFAAVQSGDWGDPATWRGGAVPTDASFTTVAIPANIAVTIPAGHIVFMQQARTYVSGFLFVGGTFSAGELNVFDDGEMFIQGGDVTVIRDLTNDGLLVDNGHLLTALQTTNGTSGVFRNIAELEIRAGQFASHGFFNHGLFENRDHAVLTAQTTGQIVLDSKFRNEADGTVMNTTGARLDVGGSLTNLGTIVNESGATLTTVSPGGRLANGSVLDNYGAVDNLATIDNTGGDFRLRCTSTLTGNAVSGSSPRNWCDDDAPILEPSPPGPTEATGAAGAAVAYHVIAKDNLDPAPTISCTPASGDTFPVGTTTVSCSATDYVGNSSTASFGVTVADTTAPNITVLGQPAVTVVQHNAYVDAGATASDIVSGNLTAQIVTTNPVDANVPGNYTVGYAVSDGAGNGATASRAVEVISPAEATDDLIADVGSLPSGSTRTELQQFLTQASRLLHDARASNDSSACRQLDLFADAVSRAQRKGAISPADAAHLTQQAAQIKSGLGC